MNISWKTKMVQVVRISCSKIYVLMIISLMNLIAHTFNATINADDADKSNLQQVAGRKTVSIFAILATEKGKGKKIRAHSPL